MSRRSWGGLRSVRSRNRLRGRQRILELPKSKLTHIIGSGRPYAVPDRDSNLYDRVAILSQAVAVAAEREKQLAQDIMHLQDRVDDHADLIAKGRGIFLALAIIGSVAGFFIGAWERLVKMFTGH